MDFRNFYVNPRVLRWGVTVVVLLIAAILVIPQLLSLGAVLFEAGADK
jgi:hypothetical protein